MGLVRKIIPPVFLLTSLILMFILDSYLPVKNIITSSFNYSGIFVGFCGLVLTANSALTFKKSGTAIKPFETSIVLKTNGLYRFTR